jgi:hypothetical protein
MGELRIPQDVAAALLLAPISPLEYRVAMLIAYRQFQFSRDEDPARSLFVEDFTGLGPGLGRTAVYAALACLEAARVVVREDRGGGRGRAARYSIRPDPLLWEFPERVHPSGRFEVVPYRERSDAEEGEALIASPAESNPTVRWGGPFLSAPADPLAVNRPPQRTKGSAPADPLIKTSKQALSPSNAYQAHAPLQASGTTSDVVPDRPATEAVWKGPPVMPARKAKPGRGVRQTDDDGGVEALRPRPKARR